MSPRLQPYVIQVPLFHALDGTDTADYVQRVEPSAQVRVRVRVTVTLTLTLTCCAEVVGSPGDGCLP